jgi:hypothetical protein
MHMPIRFHLNGQRFDPETLRVMGLAYEMTLISLRLVDRGDISNDVVAYKIMELVKAGERDAERLCEAVCQQWGRAVAHIAPPIAPGDQI